MNGSRIGKRIGRHEGCALVLFLLTGAAVPLLAQQPAPPPDPQQQGEQVHTGVTSGLDADARLQNLLADHQFLRIESQLDQLPLEEAQFYRGILANRENDLKTSIQLLEPLVEKVTASGDTAHEKLLRKALAEDYLRIGDFAKAAKAYQTLETRLQSKLSPDEQDEIEMPLKLLPLAAANPPMTVEPYDPFVLQVSKNPLGLTDIPVFVDARPHSWMLDPTAPFNLIARSLAKEAGLKVSEEASTIRTLTGRPIQVHVTVIPRFTLGGRITFRNMTAFVFEDQDYAFPHTRYQVQGVLGYPALSALGSLTITADATIEVQPRENRPAADSAQAAPPVQSGQKAETAPSADLAAKADPPQQADPAKKDDRPAQGARFFFDGDQMIVALGTPAAPGEGPSASVQKQGEERMYVIDVGGQQTYLTSRYYSEHSDEFANLKMELFSLPGAPAAPPQPAYIAETVPLTAGPTTVHVHYVQVLTQPLGSAALDDVYGVLGVDALDQLKTYTFDYRTMRFSVRPE
ncbi:MAG: retropepsin-like aspartic protease [Terracidiphilus sp.]|nr:retropepsin-like aspartic protease [Terracidiphilus sp.]MDR3776252.1 retropepsin-like aspartic protease [Terracidiphilus sp.]